MLPRGEVGVHQALLQAQGPQDLLLDLACPGQQLSLLYGGPGTWNHNSGIIFDICRAEFREITNPVFRIYDLMSLLVTNVLPESQWFLTLRQLSTINHVPVRPVPSRLMATDLSLNMDLLLGDLREEFEAVGQAEGVELVSRGGVVVGWNLDLDLLSCQTSSSSHLFYPGLFSLLLLLQGGLDLGD